MSLGLGLGGFAFVLGIALAAMGWLGGVGGAGGLATRLPMIDVPSAKIYWVSAASRAVSVPAVNPDTGERTLVGVDREPDGRWRILAQDLELVPMLGVRASPRIDAETGVVRPERGGTP